MSVREVCTWLAGASDIDVARVCAFIKSMPAATLTIDGSTYRFWNGAYYLTTSTNPVGRAITHMTWSESGVPTTICGFTVAGPIADGTFAASHTAYGAPIAGTVKMCTLLLNQTDGHDCVVPFQLIFTAEDGHTREITWGANGVYKVRQNRANGYSLAVFDCLGSLESNTRVDGNVTTESRWSKNGTSGTVTTKLNRLLSCVVRRTNRINAVTTWKLHLPGGDVEATRKLVNGIYSMSCGKYVYNFRQSSTTTFEFLGKLGDD